MKKALLILLVAAIALSMAACGGQKHASENTRDDGYSKVDAEDKEASKNESVDVKIPDGFRKDLIPVYKNSVILETQTDDGMSEFTSYIVVGYTDKDFKKVVDFYKEIASKFQIKDEQEENDFQYLSVKIDEKDSVEIFVQDLKDQFDDDIPKDAKTLFNLEYRQAK